MEPFRDDREAAARRIEELEAENRALKRDRFAHLAPPPHVVNKPGLAPGLLVLFIALPVLLLVFAGAGAAFFMVRAPSVPPQVAIPAEPVEVPTPTPTVENGDPLAPAAVPTPSPLPPSGSVPSSKGTPKVGPAREPPECALAEQYKDKDPRTYTQLREACAAKRGGL